VRRRSSRRGREGERKIWARFGVSWSERLASRNPGQGNERKRDDNRKYSDEKSPAGKVDYHTMGACYEVLNVVR